jgi:endoglucanase
MKNVVYLLSILCLLSFTSQLVPGQETALKKEHDQWWQGGFWRWPRRNPLAKKLPLIQVKGNKFVNTNGDTILFRGLAISDPDKLENQGHWSKAHFKKVKEMGATLVRIPIHPISWRNRTPNKYLKLLDQVVEWCTELEMYVILDWHSIGNLGKELFQHRMYDTTKKETYEFWRTIAGRFNGHNTIAFYEIFNEPALGQGRFGSMTWSDWKQLNEEIIRLIRAYDRETIPLVAGFDWAYDLCYLRYEPVDAAGIGYVTHPYANKRKPPWEPKWEENFGFAADRYPVIATEFGFGIRGNEKVDDNHYANLITRYLENRGISWIAWVFDPDWHPRLFKSWETYELTGAGEFFKKALHREIYKKSVEKK